MSVTQPPPSNTHGTRQPALLIVWPAEGYVVFWFLLGSVDESEEPLSQTPEMSFGSKRETKRVRRRGVVHESPFHRVTCSVSKLVVRGIQGVRGNPQVWVAAHSCCVSGESSYSPLSRVGISSRISKH